MTDNTDLTKRLPRGGIPSPRHELAAAMPHVPDLNIIIPSSFLMWPVQMDSWNNYTYGDCTTAEEAFAKATAVMTTMQTQGFHFNGKTYDDGPHFAVNWTNPAILESAIYSHGPVKIGVAAEYFQSAAPGQHGVVTPGTNGWAMYKYPTTSTQQEDHYVSLCGYGTLAQLVALFKQHGVTVHAPAGMPTGLCYAMFTWNSIGIIDQQSMLNMTHEAWIRNPVTKVK